MGAGARDAVNVISKTCPIVTLRPRERSSDMRFLRTVSTQRLLAILAGVVLAIAGGTAIAVAAAGSGPVPPRASLAQALHQAAGAPAATAISARITFPTNMIDSPP